MLYCTLLGVDIDLRNQKFVFSRLNRGFFSKVTLSGVGLDELIFLPFTFIPELIRSLLVFQASNLFLVSFVNDENAAM